MSLPPGTRAPLAVIGALAVMAIVGSALSRWDIAQMDWQHVAHAPTLADHHWLGTDRLGRDVWARWCAGLRLSLSMTLLASGASVVVGTGVGLISGYGGNRVDQWLMHLIDGLYALPYVLFVILLITWIGTSPAILALAMAAIGWLPLARSIRDETRRLRQAPFVEAAVILGLSPGRIVARHVLPNLAGLIWVQGALLAPQFILLESFLSFLGLGIHEPAASLGNLLNQGAQSLEATPWLMLFPAGTLVILVASFTRLGEACRDVHAHDLV